MKTILKMASRNIWRNRARTLITAAAVFFGVFLSVTLTSFQAGSWDSMIDGIVGSYYGYGQVHKKGYWEDQIIDNSFEYAEALKQLTEEKNITGLTPRLEGFALVVSKNNTNVRQIIGTDPEAENQLSGLAGLVIEGDYLQPNDEGVLIADTLAKDLEVGVGDTLVFLGQGFRGANSVGKFPIRGLVKFKMPQMREMIYMSLTEAQYFFAAENRLTSLILQTDKPKQIDATVAALQNKIDTAAAYEVMTWEQLIPDLIQARDLDEASGKIIPLVLYLIIGFVIFGTILMMLKERQYEFGVMTSIGMNRLSLGVMIMLETIMISFIGALGGMLLAFPIVYYFNRNPVDLSNMGEGSKETYEQFGIPSEVPFSMDPSIFTTEAITIFFLALILSLYAIQKIYRLRPIEAMRQ